MVAARFGSRAWPVARRAGCRARCRLLYCTVGQRHAAGAVLRFRSSGRLPGDCRDQTNLFNMSKSESARARRGLSGGRSQFSSGQPSVGFSMGSGVPYSSGRNLAGDLGEFSQEPRAVTEWEHLRCGVETGPLFAESSYAGQVNCLEPGLGRKDLFTGANGGKGAGPRGRGRSHPPSASLRQLPPSLRCFRLRRKLSRTRRGTGRRTRNWTKCPEVGLGGGIREFDWPPWFTKSTKGNVTDDERSRYRRLQPVPEAKLD